MSTIIRDIIISQLQQLQGVAAVVIQLVAFTLTLYSSNAYWAQPYHTSQMTGRDWVHELMAGHPERIYNELGVHLHVFAGLLIEFAGHGLFRLQEWAMGNQRPQNREELFNLRHAQARNIIERIFGVIKKRWRILTIPPAYRMSLQARIPPALAALHNFIIETDLEDRLDPTVRDDPSPGYDPRADIGVCSKPMWEQYEQYMDLDESEDETEIGEPDEEGYQSAMNDEEDDN
ncbi:DDE Tnp4 domain-containing protein [Mycena indigotica]|uniref:DDE Tnp4 domain-containing protein n=1 Tax=Mycena indigotica TaxID=2126181 RepID=A0A8H6WAW3_9AGAR|nr:DDE Tnp4 domain-containing protein [Mycena indigotica]KAF7311999.1 DDE Tnp4 domain-containing protein [Mycena indigotica]